MKKTEPITDDVLYRIAHVDGLITIYATFQGLYAYVQIQDDPDVAEDDRDAVYERIKITLAERLKKDYRATLIA